MHSSSIAQLFSLGLLAIAPLASAYVDVAGTVDLTNKRSFVGGHIARAAVPLEARHHTEAQIAAKKAKAATTKTARSVAADALNSLWDTLDKREAHHTEAQIAAKKAKSTKTRRRARSIDIEERSPHHTAAQQAAKGSTAPATAGTTTGTTAATNGTTNSGTTVTVAKGKKAKKAKKAKAAKAATARK